MRKLFRLCKIAYITLHYGLDQLADQNSDVDSAKSRLLRILQKTFFWRDLSAPRAQRLRRALEDLGPIFIKFGQVLSTRRDLIPGDLIDELSLLQDQVTPFASSTAVSMIERELKKPLAKLFTHFELEPVASASIAQVHQATLHDGRVVAVKVLRPGMLAIIEKDLSLMRTAATWVERLWLDGKRLKPREVIAEFDKYLHDELDLMHEAANASQLRRNFAQSHQLLVPEMYWDYCTSHVMVMQWMDGIPISQTHRLSEAGIDLPQLARNGVEIFFTQVFRDGFFHADMHPGNILVSAQEPHKGSYIALDFGIVGTLNDHDRDYLAQNFLAFFQRDYKRVAAIHVECGWAPKDTPVNELEAAIRACCEPIFDQPLKNISFGQLLLRLFQTSRRFNIEVQPQLVLLQKTLLNIEGLGRQLDPELDLWKTAKPYLERWMQEQVGWRGFVERLKVEAPQWGQIFPQLPRLLQQYLQNISLTDRDQTHLLRAVLQQQKRITQLLDILIYGSLGLITGFLIHQLWVHYA